MSINLDELTASVTVDVRRGRRKFKVNVALDWDEEWWADVFPPDGVTLTPAERRRCCARAKTHVARMLSGVS